MVFFPYKDDHCFFERVCNQQFPGEYAFNGLWLYRNLIGFSFFFFLPFLVGYFESRHPFFFWNFGMKKFEVVKGTVFFLKWTFSNHQKNLDLFFFGWFFYGFGIPWGFISIFHHLFGRMLLFFWSIFSIAVSSRIKSKEANPKKRIQLTLSSDDVKPRNLKNGEALDTKSWKKPTWKKCLSKTARKKVSFLG